MKALAQNHFMGLHKMVSSELTGVRSQIEGYLKELGL